MNGVCDLKYAIELEQLGFKQEGLFWWVQDNSKQPDCYPKPINGWRLLTKDIIDNIGFEAYIVAPTVSELGELLPLNVSSYRGDISSNPSVKSLVWLCTYKKKVIIADTEANVRVQMLIYLIKKGIVKL